MLVHFEEAIKDLRGAEIDSVPANKNVQYKVKSYSVFSSLTILIDSKFYFSFDIFISIKSDVGFMAQQNWK